MAWPSYATFVLDDITEDFDPSVERTEMERGIPKQRVINSSVMAQISGTVLFKSSADITSFETWYFTTINRIGWFDFIHPRTRSTIEARIVGGRLGPLVPIRRSFAFASREVTLEYLR